MAELVDAPDSKSGHFGGVGSIPSTPTKYMKLLKSLYTWTLNKAEHKYSSWILSIVSFAESSFFPIPPDILLIPMIMPIDMPLWMLAISVVFAVLIAKEAFGGTGMNILNPALTARAFAFFAYPTFMSGDKVWVSEASNIDAISGETILGALAANGDVTYSSFNMFMGSIPGSVAETSVFFVLIGALILILTGVGSWRIIISGILGASLVGILFNLWGANSLMSFDWYNHLLVGGFAFGIVFMATDPVSAAQTTKGKWIYGFLVGVFCILIRVFNPAYPEGVMLAILLMNVFAPLIDHYVIESNVSKRRKRWENIKLKTA